MTEVTLESLAKRVEELERRIGVVPPEQSSPIATPGTEDWAAVREAVASIEDYDFDALPAMDAASIEDQKRMAELWNDPD